MYFTFECPHCRKKLKVQEEAAGKKAGCPYCKHSLVVPQAPPEQPEGTAAFEGIGDRAKTPAPGRTEPVSKRQGERKRKSTGSGWADRTDVGILQSGLIALAFTAVALAMLFPLANFYVGELFLKRGWVPFVLLFFLGWSIGILALKWRKLKRQRASMLFDLLPADISPDISEKSVDSFVEHIHSLPVEPGESFLVNRVLRGLEHFQVRKSNPEVANLFSSQSEIDANAVQSSYTLLNVFIWAIPILGFIGTVIGISAAVGSFSGSLEQAQDISVLKESLNGVTGGLATAFDTTLVALVMSIMVMFPTSALQKAEEDLLNSVDAYCNENLLKRLSDGAGGDGRPLDPAAGLRQAIDAALAGHHAELQAWNQKLESIGSQITTQVVRGWGAINKELQRQQKENVDQIKDFDAIVAQFQRTLANLAEKTAVVHRQAAGSMTSSAEALGGYCSGLQQGLTGLNAVLAELGEKQVVVQQVPRRGWFFRRK